MVTDIGGFAASTFKRGIDYINITTTLLSMVDASVGGKTGINFNGLKNEIGVFKKPKKVILDTVFLKTLDSDNILSGYAEMLKHGLISTIENLDDILSFDFNNINYGKLTEMVAKSVAIKEFVVEQDPYENGMRKALNIGHTVGHAFESWSLKRKPCLHGDAVAWGLVCELYLSWIRLDFNIEILNRIVNFVLDKYDKLCVSESDLDELYEFMTHDKKNSNGLINFTLLRDVGDICINEVATKEEIFEMFGYYIRL